MKIEYTGFIRCSVPCELLSLGFQFFFAIEKTYWYLNAALVSLFTKLQIDPHLLICLHRFPATFSTLHFSSSLPASSKLSPAIRFLFSTLHRSLTILLSCNLKQNTNACICKSAVAVVFAFSFDLSCSTLLCRHSISLSEPSFSLFLARLSAHCSAIKLFTQQAPTCTN